MQKKELTKNKQLKENIRGVMGLSLLFNPTQLSLFEKYLLKNGREYLSINPLLFSLFLSTSELSSKVSLA